jgi:ribosomal-protein-alanine N-acetyltransferase
MAPQLRSARLTLRPLRDGDAETLWELWNDPAVYEYVGDGRVRTLAELRVGVERFVAHWSERGWGPFLVTQNTDGQAIGECGLYPVADEAHEDSDEIELGYRYGQQWWGRGYGTEAARAVMDWATNDLGLLALISIVREGNLASRRIAESLGFTIIQERPVENLPTPTRDLWYRWNG